MTIRTTTTVFIGLLALCVAAAPAAGQTVFFDDFDGNDLKPHWKTTPPERWDYEVRDSKLFINELFWPSDPHGGRNEAQMWADLTSHLGDFDLYARTGWEQGSVANIIVGIVDSGGFLIAWMQTGPGIITANTRIGRGEMFGNPGPGTHDFVIRRRGTDVDFLLNGGLLTTLSDFGNPAAEVTFRFLEHYPRPPGPPVHVDIIRVVPAPGAALICPGAAFILLFRRRTS
jgi:hypothetical protein